MRLLDHVSFVLLAVAFACLSYLPWMRSPRPSLGYDNPILLGYLELFRWVGPPVALLFAVLALTPGASNQSESSIPLFLFALVFSAGSILILVRERWRAVRPRRVRPWQDGDPVPRRRRVQRWMH